MVHGNKKSVIFSVVFLSTMISGVVLASEVPAEQKKQPVSKATIQKLKAGLHIAKPFLTVAAIVSAPTIRGAIQDRKFVMPALPNAEQAAFMLASTVLGAAKNKELVWPCGLEICSENNVDGDKVLVRTIYAHCGAVKALVRIPWTGLKNLSNATVVVHADAKEFVPAVAAGLVAHHYFGKK